MYLIALTVLVMSTITARKTYHIKNGIQQGDLKVLQPRVAATTTEWCWFKDSDNDFCFTVTENWKVGFTNSYDYQQQTTSSSTPANYKQQLDIYSTQSAIWVSKFNLKRFFYNQYTFSLKEFTTGCRFEAYNWLDDYAWCLNVVFYIKPITIDLIAKTQMEDCSKVLINTIDDFSNWKLQDALILETCGLSSASDVTAWTYSPILVDYEYYLLGKSEYQMRFCWPGKSPFYSFFDQYPANPVWAIYKMVFALDQFQDFSKATAGSAYAMYAKAIVDTLSQGIDTHQKVMDGHKVKRNITVEEMNQEIDDNQKNAFEAILL